MPVDLTQAGVEDLPDEWGYFPALALSTLQLKCPSQ
jgi:hypothetical protein